MTLEAFAPSHPLTLGVELELQLLSTHDYDLTPYAADMLRLMRQHHPDLPGTVVPGKSGWCWRIRRSMSAA